MATTSYAGLETAGSRINVQLSAAIEGALDRALYDPTDLGMFAVMVPYNPGSDTNQGTRRPAPTAFTAATNETTGGASSTTYTPTSFTLSPTRRYAKYDPNSLAILTDPTAADPEDPRFPAVVADMVRLLIDGVKLTLTDDLAALFTSISTTVGTSATALTVSDIFDAYFALNLANVAMSPENPPICALHNVQMNHFIEDIRGETGPLAFVPATAELMRARGPGVRGTWNGFLMVQADSCPLSDTNANRNGAMFAADAFAYQMMPVGPLARSIPKDSVMLASDYLLLTHDYDHDNARPTYYGNIWLAAAIADSVTTRAVRIRSSAT